MAYCIRAWDETKSTPLDAFGNVPLLKTTGVAIVLATLLEEVQRVEDAYTVYEDAFMHMVSKKGGSANAGPKDPPDAESDLGKRFMSQLGEDEKLRVAAISYKLGELAFVLQKTAKEEEKWLVWSVMTSMIATANVTAGKSVDSDEVIRLPLLSEPHGPAAPFEALGSFYARHGEVK